MKKRILALLLSVVLTVSSLMVGLAVQSVANTLDIPDEIPYFDDFGNATNYVFETVASNDRFELDFDEETTFFRVVDKTTGEAWYSNPPISPGDDPYVAGIGTTNMRSVLYVSYTKVSLDEAEANSYAASVKKGAYEVKEIENGVRVDYTFVDQKFVIPVQYTLTEEGFRAEILFDEIQENGGNTLNRIQFLQYFGTAGRHIITTTTAATEATTTTTTTTTTTAVADVEETVTTTTTAAATQTTATETTATELQYVDDEGYLVIPDGAGAIVKFNNAKTASGLSYSKDIYGIDQAKVTAYDQQTSRSESITLPIFGMVKNGYGFLAEVVSGAEIATLKATASCTEASGAYSTISTMATYRINYKVALMGQVSETSNAMFNAEDPASCETYAIEYRFSDSDQTTYATLASMYRDTLLERGWLEKDTVTDKLYTEFYGGVSKTKSFLGIVYEARETLTSFEDAEDILADLKEGGVANISAQYVNYADDFFSRNMEIKLNPSSSLGGKKGMSALLDFAAEGGLILAPSADFVTMPSGGHGYSTYSDTADVINIEPITVYPYSLSSNTTDSTRKPYYLVEPTKYGDALDSLIEAAEKYGYTAYYFDEDSLQLYSDLAPEGAQSEVTSVLQAEAMAKLAEAGLTLTMANPNAYLFRYADEMVEIPVCSSKEMLFDAEIPFLQMVLRGVKNFGGESMNITDVSEEAFLRHLEYGTDMRYSLITADSEALLNTDHTFLYSATYSNFADQIKTRYAAFEELGEAVDDANIVGHTKEGNIAVTTYSNGTKVIVNYNAESVTIDGTTVDAMSYAIV